MENFSFTMEVLEPVLGIGKKAGDDIKYKCPICGETKYKFYVVVDDDSELNVGSYHCWVCESSGGAIKLMNILYHDNYNQAKERLAEVGIDMDLTQSHLSFKKEFSYSDSLTEEEKLYLSLNKHKLEGCKNTEVVNLKAPKFPTGLKSIKDNINNPESFPFQMYLKNRGVTLEQIIKHNIQYVINGSVDKINSEGKMLIKNSIIFITYDNSGQPIFWNTRSIEKDVMLKSYNAPAREGEYMKNNVIFNLNVARTLDKLVICESVFNALTVGDEGVATFGKKMTSGQIKLIKQAIEFNPNLNIYIFTDTDAKREGNEQAKRISEFTPNVYLVDNPYKDKDANDLGHDISWQLINNAKKFNQGSSLGYLLTGI